MAASILSAWALYRNPELNFQSRNSEMKTSLLTGGNLEQDETHMGVKGAGEGEITVWSDRKRRNIHHI